jgi:hypothetical protein
MYPSGRWVGFYVQSGRRAPMSLALTFEAGAVAGGGVDPVGDFYVRGNYDPGGSVEFTKQYLGGHAVQYAGSRAGEGIVGQWRMHRMFRGAFRIWPIEGDVEEAHVGEAAEQGVAGQTATPVPSGVGSSGGAVVLGPNALAAFDQ